MFKTLLVDDRQIFVEELKRCDVWGEASGFCCAGQASNGLEALELLRKSAYDLVITDIRMPKIDGIELLQEIKKQNLCPCVVLISEHSEFAYARQGLVLGAFDYLVKPVGTKSLRELFGRVTDFLKGRAMSALSHENGAPDIQFHEKRLTDTILTAPKELDAAAEHTINELHALYGSNLDKNVSALNRILNHVVAEVWRRCGWLKQFYRKDSFDNVYSRQFANLDSYRLFFKAAVRQLSACVRQFQPVDPDTTIGRVCLYMLEHPEEDISLKAMADQFYINRSYLSNTFRKKTGSYFMEYLTAIRMERARYLLETGDVKIYEVCLQLGYHDQEYFSKLFKKTIGVSPMALRRPGQGQHAG